VIMTPLEIKGAAAGVITSVFILVATFTAGGIYRNHIEKEMESGTSRSMLQAWLPEDELFSFKAVLTAMVKTRMGARTPRAF
jgi:hypothetical protein